MLSEITTAPTRDIFPQEDNYRIVETQANIQETINQLRTAGCTKIALVTITLTYKEKTGQARLRQAERAREGSAFLLQNIRSLVRKTDRVLLYEQSMYFVLLEANLQGAQIVEERLWQALLWRTHNMGSQEYLRPLAMTIGHAADSETEGVAEDLLGKAAQPTRHFGTVTEKATTTRTHKRSPLSIDQQVKAEKEDLHTLAKKMGIPYLSLLPRKLPKSVLHTLNAHLARELHCYPVGRERNILTVAMLDPQDHSALERLHKETGLHIFPVLTHPETLETALKQFN